MLIDSHCHLSSFLASNRLSSVLNLAEQRGIWRIITVGTSTEDWETYRKLASDYAGRIYYTAGLHPGHVEEDWESQLDTLEAILNKGDKVRPVAIGETGLDYFRLPADPAAATLIVERQKASFIRQIGIAAAHELPLIVHSRSAFDDCIRIIDQSGFPWNNVVFHCFSEGPDAMKRLNLRGGRGSFTGIITYGNASAIRNALVEQGIDRLMIETDAPYLAPVPQRGKENEPGFLVHTADAAAQLLHMTPDNFRKQVWENTCRFFKIV